MKAGNFFTRAIVDTAQKITASWGWNSGSTSSSSGGSWDGSKMRGSLRSMYASGADLDFEALRARSRAAYWDSTQARALLTRLVDNVIGTGLTLEASPLWELNGSPLSEEAKRLWSRDVEQRFFAWASSHESDSTGRRNLAELQNFIFANELRDGESVIILRYSGDTSRVSPLTLQVLDPDQIDTLVNIHGTPDRVGLAVAIQSRGNVFKDGIEFTPQGEPVALFLYDATTRKTTRVPFSGPSGRRFIIMPAILDLPGQVRGVGPLAAVIHEIQKLTDYTLFEIESALVNAIIAAYIVPNAENDTRTNLQSAIGGGVTTRGSGIGAPANDTGDKVKVREAGLFIGNLKKGEDIKSFDTKRPNVNFEGFVSAITKSISASLSIPVEVLEMKFGASYSASRAGLIMFWQTVDRWRVHFNSQFLQLVYESWFAEEIRASRISAPGFDSSPLIKRAWLSCSWIGDSMPTLDPTKDAAADQLRIDMGATTRERVAMEYNGSDFYDNARRLKIEKEALPPVDLPGSQFQQPQKKETDTEDGETA